MQGKLFSLMFVALTLCLLVSCDDQVETVSFERADQPVVVTFNKDVSCTEKITSYAELVKLDAIYEDFMGGDLYNKITE